ncbi:MAG: hypothetical protein SOW59_06725 [Corynebacterium sp.]|nr:hypothetical protein [Corynebacterium sp.]
MTTSHNAADMHALGFSYDRWQDAVEAAIATDKLSVIGEVRGGQHIQYLDPSGAQLNILAVEPFATFIGFESISSCFAHVSMLNDVLGLLEIVTPAGEKIMEVTANLAQGPLLAEAEPQQWQQVGFTAMGIAVTSFNSAENYVASENAVGTEFPALISAGADIIRSGSGTEVPDAGVLFAATVIESEWRENHLTGEKFIHAVLDGVFPIDLCLPECFGELPTKGTVLAGTAVLTSRILTPLSSCGTSGGCGCGSGGCGGH